MAQTLGHSSPLWGARADSTIVVRNRDDHELRELLAVRSLSKNQFEICCLPFVVYEACLGDIIEVDPVERHVTARVFDAGRYLFRVSTLNSRPGLRANDVASQIGSIGFAFETCGMDLVAVDSASDRAQELADFLKEGQSRGEWQYETGR